jgi:DNA repair exonuclease SbcCD ATPase subunit
VKSVKGMVSDVLKSALDITEDDYQTAGEKAAESFTSGLQKKMSYTLNKISHQNEQKLKEFDDEVDRLNKEQSEKEKALNKKADAAKKKNQKEAIKNEIEALKEQYKAEIEAQKKAKSEYQKASAEMISGLTTALNSYQQKAQELIQSTINGISEKFQARYDALIDKQNNLIRKLKSAGELFTISDAGVMTINDIRMQTKNIRDYAAKLEKIKSKVSSELFDEIAELDMEEGGAFMDRLLSMSASDLEDYNKAYEEKAAASRKAAETIYKGDIDATQKAYSDELQAAFANLPEELEALGAEALKGFVTGLTSDTDYMAQEIRTFIAAMVDQFKTELDIHSPSKLMAQLGGYTGAGFVDGFKDKISDIKEAAQEMAASAAVPLNAAGNNANNYPGSYGVTNNYNLVQNNTSPRSLSALETFQARRRQIALVKALT